MSRVQIELPDEVLALVGSPEVVQTEAKEAFVFNLVRKGKLSRAKAAELLGVSLWDLPELLSRYEIPWFHYRKDNLEQDLKTLREVEEVVGDQE
jgi:predicted HTH domain antitoxin